MVDSSEHHWQRMSTSHRSEGVNHLFTCTSAYADEDSASRGISAEAQWLEPQAIRSIVSLVMQRGTPAVVQCSFELI
jgi:hypothetical protein